MKNKFYIVGLILVGIFTLQIQVFAMTQDQEKELDQQLKKTAEQQERYDKILTTWETLQKQEQQQLEISIKMREDQKNEIESYKQSMEKYQKSMEENSKSSQEVKEQQLEFLRKKSESDQKMSEDYHKQLDEYKKQADEYNKSLQDWKNNKK